MDLEQFQQEHAFLTSVGGKLIMEGSEGKPPHYNFGWIPIGEAHPVVEAHRDAVIKTLQPFKISGGWQLQERRYPLWKIAKALLNGFLPYNWQLTGSCVGAGGGNMSLTGQAVEIAQGSIEEFHELWWPYTYGQSRVRSGMSGRGEGSTGAGYADAATHDGSFGIHEKSDLPKFTKNGGWNQLTEAIEMQWSDGRYGDQFDPLGIKHLWKTAAVMHNSDDCTAALVNGYCITQASNFGFSPMVPKPQGDPPIRLVKWNGSWSHQTYIDEVWDHPQFGMVFRWGNNWGPDAHGPALADEPPSSVYIEPATLDKICKTGEVYAFSFFDGFPARKLHWYV